MAKEAFAVIREAMRKEELVGLARVVIYRREHLLLLAPRGKGLMATTLRYKTEVRDEKNYFDDIEDIKIPADMLKLAGQILDSKKGHFKPEKFEDRYENALMALIKAKHAGKAPPELAEERPSNVVNLMDALRRSARGDRSERASSSSSSSRSRTKSSTGRKRTTTSRRKVKRAS
jgi:DNA end-binding protein Ku